MAGLQPRAILEGRKSNRTPIPIIVGLVACGVCTLAVLVLYFFTGGALPTVIGMFLAVPTAVLMVALVLWVDRLEPEPRSMLAFAFAWGAGFAVAVALVLNTLNAAILSVPFGASTSSYFAATFGAPPIEESAKGSFLLGLLLLRRGEIDGPTDGIVYAAMVGLGFALVENVNYYVMGLHEGGSALLLTLVLRGVASPLCHPLFTSMTGLGVAYAATHTGGTRWHE